MANFQTWCALYVRFSKENCSLETYLPDFKTGKIVPLPVFKSSQCTPRNLLSSRSQGLDLTGFEKLSANSKGFGALQLRTYYSISN
jgi:hypothetical protein